MTGEPGARYRFLGSDIVMPGGAFGAKPLVQAQLDQAAQNIGRQPPLTMAF